MKKISQVVYVLLVVLIVATVTIQNFNAQLFNKLTFLSWMFYPAVILVVIMSIIFIIAEIRNKPAIAKSKSKRKVEDDMDVKPYSEEDDEDEETADETVNEQLIAEQPIDNTQTSQNQLYIGSKHGLEFDLTTNGSTVRFTPKKRTKIIK